MTMTFREFVGDSALGGAFPPFHDRGPWRAWLTVGDAADGLPLDATGRQLFKACTGRPYDPPPGGFSEIVSIEGRQSGKTTFLAARVVYAAITAPPARGGELYAILIAQDQRNSIRTAFSYCKAIVDTSPIMRRAIVRETSSTLTLENNVVIAAYPCRPAAIRGIRAVIVGMDEAAFYRSSEMLPQDAEMLQAARPTLATTGGKLFLATSPHSQAGAVWELHRRYYGQAEARTLVWQASAPTMNPLLSADYLDRMRETDPAAYRAEVLGLFRDDVASFVTREVVDAVVISDRRELPPSSEMNYVTFVDPSGGSSDSFTLAIAHREGDRVVLDLIRERRPPFSPDVVVEEYAATAKLYRCMTVHGDRYGGQWPRERFAVHGVRYCVADKTRSELYATLLPLLNAQRVELLDDRRLVAQLVRLERRTARGGRESIDHPVGGHDDVVNAVAGALVLAGTRTATPEDFSRAISRVGGGPRTMDPLRSFLNQR